MSSNREQHRLRDIIEEIEAIESYTGATNAEALANDRLTRDATERCLERIIEAVMKIGEERMSELMPDLPFAELRGLGNRLRHAYDMIEVAPIIAVVRNDLPWLKAACLDALIGK